MKAVQDGGYGMYNEDSRMLGNMKYLKGWTKLSMARDGKAGLGISSGIEIQHGMGWCHQRQRENNCGGLTGLPTLPCHIPHIHGTYSGRNGGKTNCRTEN